MSIHLFATNPYPQVKWVLASLPLEATKFSMIHCLLQVNMPACAPRQIHLHRRTKTRHRHRHMRHRLDHPNNRHRHRQHWLFRYHQLQVHCRLIACRQQHPQRPNPLRFLPPTVHHFPLWRANPHRRRHQQQVFDAQVAMSFELPHPKPSFRWWLLHQSL